MNERLGFVPDPDNSGWMLRRASKAGRFVDIFGEVRGRMEPDGRVRLRLDTRPEHRNINETVHGGFALALVDQALFMAPVVAGVEGVAGGVTIDVASQFFAPLLIGKPLDVLVEILRETRRMVFVRGLIEQDGVAAVAFSGTIKKAR